LAFRQTMDKCSKTPPKNLRWCAAMESNQTGRPRTIHSTADANRLC
jgi:hypothetical protein